MNFYCTYCRYYGTDPITGEVDHSHDFTGTRAAVVRHAHKHPIGDPTDMAAPIEDDLPKGYRWANEDECEAYAKATSSVPGVIVVKRTFDCNGIPYTQDEADLAVPA
jgi:hypothetical protein